MSDLIDRLKAEVFNPHNEELCDLPVIYGFNKGGSHGWMSAALIAQDGTYLGGHACTSEAYMPHDLGILEGSRPDRHDEFRKHYPRGYKMEFVGCADVPTHVGLNSAFALSDELAKLDQEKDV